VGDTRSPAGARRIHIAFGATLSATGAVLATLRGYRRAWIPGDLIAGALLAAIAIPEQLATARLAGMPAQTGLYAFAAGTIAFAIVGSNRFLSVGADSTIAPIFAGGVAALASAGAPSYPVLVSLAAVLIGAALVLAGMARAGWIADLLSIPVTTGFLAGIALHIIVGQLPAVLGLPAPPGSLVQAFVAILAAIPHANPIAFALGGGVLLVTLVAERISARIPGALIALIAAGVVAATLDLRAHGIALLGALPATLPHVGWPLVDVHDVVRLVPLVLTVALVCLLQISVVLRAYPTNPDAPDDPSRDFAAVGIGSIVAGLLGSFAVDASPPRTAIAAASGARSQLAGIAAVAAIVLLVAFGASLAAYLPLAALGGVLIFIGSRLFRLADMQRIARAGGQEGWLVIASMLLVVVLPIETGMLFAIALSLAGGIAIVARPPSGEFVRVPGTTIWWPPDRTTPGERVPGVLVFAPAAPLTFTNSQFIVGKLRALIAAAAAPVRLVIVECSGVIDVDYTGAFYVSREISRLRAGGVNVVLARLSDDRARAAAVRTGLIAAVGTDGRYDSVAEALAARFP
jgi:MFS superfamily sulfate permease-like transporter